MRARLGFVLGLSMLLGCMPVHDLALPSIDGGFVRALVAFQVNGAPFLWVLTPQSEASIAMPESTPITAVFFDRPFDLAEGQLDVVDEGGREVPEGQKAVFVSEVGGEAERSWREVSEQPAWLRALRIEGEPADAACFEFDFTPDQSTYHCAMDRFGDDSILVALEDASLAVLRSGEPPETLFEAKVFRGANPTAIYVFEEGRKAWIGQNDGRFRLVEVATGTISDAHPGFADGGSVIAMDGAPDGSEVFAVLEDGTLLRHRSPAGWEQMDGTGGEERQQRRSVVWVQPGEVLRSSDANWVWVNKDGVEIQEHAQRETDDRLGTRPRFTALLDGGSKPYGLTNVDLDSTPLLQRFIYRRESADQWVRLDRTGIEFDSLHAGEVTSRGIWYGGTGGTFGIHVFGLEEPCGSHSIGQGDILRLIALESGRSAAACTADLHRLFWLATQ